MDAVLPPLCLGCNEIVGEPGGLCAACWQDFNFVTAPHCACCGTPFEEDLGAEALCAGCMARVFRCITFTYLFLETPPAAPPPSRARSPTILSELDLRLIVLSRPGLRDLSPSTCPYAQVELPAKTAHPLDRAPFPP